MGNKLKEVKPEVFVLLLC